MTFRDIFNFFLLVPCSGQPGVITPPRKHKDILYTGLVGDGTLLPPVIITSDDKLPRLEFDKPAFVVLLPSSKAPTARSAKAWFNKVKDWMEDDPILLLDNGGAHHNPEFLQELHEFGIRTEFYPPYAGSLVDPCDNSFHSVLKRIYFSKDRSTHEKCIRAMVEAYYEVSEQAVLSSFERCGYTGAQNPHQVTARLLSQGYEASQQKIHELNRCSDTYVAWKRVFRSAVNGSSQVAEPNTLPNDTLDGTYWQTYTL